MSDRQQTLLATFDVIATPTETVLYNIGNTTAPMAEFYTLETLSNLGPDRIQYRIRSSSDPWVTVEPGETVEFRASVRSLRQLYVRGRGYWLPSTVRVVGRRSRL